MKQLLCISVRFLQPYFHGRDEAGEPEWPPSPLRMFQALVAAGSAGPETGRLSVDLAEAISWLERQEAPKIVATSARPAAAKYRLYVPDNVADKVAKSWSGGRDASIADYRTEKDVRPMCLDGDAVHYLYSLPDEAPPFFTILSKTARRITHLGWGVDMVAGDASLLSQEDVAALVGERWYPNIATSAAAYRIPTRGSLEALIRKHRAFLERVGPDGFRPVPPLGAFATVDYGRANAPDQPRFAAFSILKSDASGVRIYDTERRLRDVAGMARHAVAELASRQGWSTDKINVFVHGKTADGAGPSTGELSPDRFSYLPLPTVNHGLGGRIESIRRVLISAPPQSSQEVEWIRRALSGEELKNDAGQPDALLTILPTSDWVLRQYVDRSQKWSTVTPVILPGHDDRKSNKTDKLLRSAFEQAGFKRELIDLAQFEWRKSGFMPGAELASRYLPPKNLENRPRYHVRVRFPSSIAGPIAIGSGRFRGFGLFVKMEQK